MIMNMVIINIVIIISGSHICNVRPRHPAPPSVQGLGFRFEGLKGFNSAFAGDSRISTC